MKKTLLILIISSGTALAADPPLTWSKDPTEGSPSPAGNRTLSDMQMAIGVPAGDSPTPPNISPAIGESIRAEIQKDRLRDAKRRQLADKAGVDQKPVISAEGSPSQSAARAENPFAAPSEDPTKAAVVVNPFAPAPAPPRAEENSPTLSILSNAAAGTNTAPVMTQKESRNNEIEVTDSRKPSRGVNVRTEMPSVRHITMSPGNQWFGGDDVEIAISPIFDIVMQMPDAVEWFNPSSDSLIVEKVPKQPTMLKLKLKPIQNPVPMSLQVVDVNQKIWTFTVVGVKADLAMEYPKTLLVNKKVVRRTVIGSRNPSSILNALPVEYAVQVVVGDLPNTSEFKTSLVGATYMHHEGYSTYLFSISKKDGSAFEKVGTSKSPNLKFTMWASGHRVDGGGLTSSGDAGTPGNADKESTTSGLTRDVEWTIETASLSKAATHKNGVETYIVICQVRASLLDLEEWDSSFITISDSVGYTRFDFAPYRREFRAPTASQSNSEE